MRVIVFGGTSEGEEIACRLVDAGLDVTVCVATEYGDECQERTGSLKVIAGRQDAARIEKTVANADICIDATHPYAYIASENIRQGCLNAGVRLMRYVRPEDKLDDDVITVNDAAGAAEILQGIEGNVLLTTGAKELATYAGADPERLYPRVLPLESSLNACIEAGIPAKNIIAMHGPFIEEMNDALIHQYDIQTMVSKNSGKAGGFEDKLSACRKNGCRLIVIGRPVKEQGWDSIDAMIKECLED
ncbi:MAG: precorrin-6A reductase, partial [Lentihominibacter sp.]